MLLVEEKAESPEGVKYINVPGLLRTAGGVQHESTATGLDSGGLMRTSWDGDLHRCTSVDVLPLYGMQVLVSLWDVALA
jgi:hypothetical protein